jgi:predicted MFS family arabinose efflux permease
VRGIALPAVGGLLAAAGGAGLLVVPLAGILLDRIGARRVLTGILVGQAAAQVLLAWAHNAVTALPVLLLYGATWSPMFPVLQTMIAGHNPEPETQRRAFAINFTTQNAALGLGSTVGAIVHHPGTFQALFLANAATCLLFAVALPFLPSLHRPRERMSRESATAMCWPAARCD